MILRTLQATIATFLFELQRSLTGQKISAALLLALFPPALMFLIFRLVQQEIPAEFVMAVLLWMIGLLSLLLWVPPNIYSELEGQTWILSTSRPYGRVSLLLGKYFAAIAWTLLIEFTALGLTIAVCLPIGVDLTPFVAGFSKVIILAAVAYGAVFSLFGVLALKRAMGFAVGYCLVSEIFIATVPAIVQKFTVRYHLQSLSLKWISGLGLDRLADADVQDFIKDLDPLPSWGNVLALLGFGVVLMTVSIVTANFRQFITHNEA